MYQIQAPNLSVFVSLAVVAVVVVGQLVSDQISRVECGHPSASAKPETRRQPAPAAPSGGGGGGGQQASKPQAPAPNGVDDLMRETFQLLDELDQSLANVNNRTPSALVKDSLRSVQSDGPNQPAGQPTQPSERQKQHQPRSLKLVGRHKAHEDDAGGHASVDEDDDELVRLASSFSSGRKLAPGNQDPQQAEDTLLMVASTDQQQQQQQQATGEPPNSKRPRQLVAAAAAASPSSSGAQQDNQSNQGHADSSLMLLSENDSTERHIKFAINLMQAVFFSNQAAGGGGGGPPQAHSKPQQKPSGPPSELQQLNAVESFLVSPLSIQMVLMMLQLGARGQTRRELNNCLNLLTASGHEAPQVVPQLAPPPPPPKLKRRQPQQQQPSPTSSGQRANQQQQQQQQPQKQTNSSSRHQQVSGNNNNANNNNLGAHELFSGSMRNLLKDPVVMKAFTSANQILLQRNLPLSGQFEWALRHYYGADLKQVDFQQQQQQQQQHQPQPEANNSTSTGNKPGPSQDVRQMINDWVERQTRGRIVDFLGAPVPASTLLMAINVLFFKGDWQYRFDPADTQSDSWFTLANGKTARVPMMVNKLPLAYAHDGQLRASMVELPYKAQRLGLFVLLPDEPAGILHTMRSLNSSSFASLISSMRKPSQEPQPTNGAGGGAGGINVRIPKFTIESSPRLAQVLSQQLGLKSLFSPDLADLSGMFASGGGGGSSSLPGPTLSKRTNLTAMDQQQQQQQPPPPPPQVGLDELLHKAVLQVDEQGSVAAAASSTAIERIDNKHSQYFEADHPFLLFLMDKQTGLVLFSGVYAGPSQAAAGGQQAPPASLQPGGLNATTAAAAAATTTAASNTGGQHQVAPAS